MRVVIVDDHPVVRHGVLESLSMEQDIEVVGMASDSDEGLELLLSTHPDVAIVDLKMPGGGGLALIRQARQKDISCRFVILTSYASYKDVTEAVTENVDGYMLKEALPEELISAIRLVAQGRRYYDPEIVDSVMNNKKKDPFQELTKRELEILEALASGFNNRAISKNLYISENTVKKHICNLLEKLGMEDRTQAALFAFSHGLGKREDVPE